MLVRSQWGGGWALGDRVLAGAGDKAKPSMSPQDTQHGAMAPSPNSSPRAMSHRAAAPQGPRTPMRPRCPRAVGDAVPHCAQLKREITGTEQGENQERGSPRAVEPLRLGKAVMGRAPRPQSFTSNSAAAHLPCMDTR